MDVRFACFTAAARLPDRAAGDGQPSAGRTGSPGRGCTGTGFRDRRGIESRNGRDLRAVVRRTSTDWPAHVGLETELTTALRQAGGGSLPGVGGRAAGDTFQSHNAIHGVRCQACGGERDAVPGWRHLADQRDAGAASGDLAARPRLDCVDERLSSTTRIAGSASERCRVEPSRGRVLPSESRSCGGHR